MKVIEWVWSMELPIVDRIHETILAFLRTSEFGLWEPSENERNDVFVLHFHRGRWKRSFLSRRLAPNWSGKRLQSAPLKLRVTLRPSSVDIVVNLQFLFCHDLRFFAEGQERQVWKSLADEVAGLATYLAKVYRSPQLPSPTLI
jgi:hypothetical protein